MRSVNGNLALANVQTLGDLYDCSIAGASLAMLVLALTGTVALLLALVGIYGVYCYTIARRRQEIGIRVALGAQQGQLRRMFLTHAVMLTCVGVAIGIVMATALTKLIASQLFGVSPLDPLTCAAGGLVLIATAAIASYLPARHASAVDPRGAFSVD